MMDLANKYWAHPQDVVDYIQAEIVDTLEEDLRKMEREERAHYTDEDRQDMRNRIMDVKAVIKAYPWDTRA